MASGGIGDIHDFESDSAESDLVLLDLMMPRMRGEKVFQRLREMTPQGRIIISTGNPEGLNLVPF